LNFESLISVVPCKGILLHSILFHTLHTYWLQLHGAAGYISQSNKQERQITYHSQSNSKLVELQKLLLGETGNADFRGESWCTWTKRGHAVLIEFSTTTDAWENQRESEIYKMCILQIMLLSDKLD